MTKLNHMICPTCGHDCYVDAEYTTCSACRTFYYAAQSRTRKADPPPLAGTPDMKGT